MQRFLRGKIQAFVLHASAENIRQKLQKMWVSFDLKRSLEKNRRYIKVDEKSIFVVVYNHTSEYVWMMTILDIADCGADEARRKVHLSSVETARQKEDSRTKLWREQV